MFPGGCQAACLRNGWGSEQIFRAGSRVGPDYYIYSMHGPSSELLGGTTTWCNVWGAADIRDCNQTLFIHPTIGNHQPRLTHRAASRSYIYLYEF